MLTTTDDIARMSASELQALLLEYQAKQRDLERQNQALRDALANNSQSIDYHVTLACIVIDEAGVIQQANDTAKTLFGCPDETLVSQSLSSFIHPAHEPAFAGNLDAFFDLTNLPNPLPLQKHDGSPLYVDCIAANRSAVDGNTLIFLSFYNVTDYKAKENNLIETIDQLEEGIRKKTTDLTESYQALEKTVDELNQSRHQLLEREAKLNSILNASIEGIIVIDTGGTIVSVNAAVENIFGFSAEELIGDSVNLLMPITLRKKQGNNLEKYLKVIIPRIIGQIREVEGLRKDGSLVPLDMTIAEFPLDGMQYYSGIVRDVSARKLQEQQEKEHLEKLAHVTRLGLMGEMASGIAHEVNQPLSAVVNYTQVCLRFIQNENPDMAKIAETLNKANQQALKAGQIIHSMREFVKPRKIHRSTVDINELIYDAIGIFEADFKQHLIAMRFELTKNLPPVIIDQVQIEQVILNLIRNSIDALKELPQFTQRQLSVETSLNPANYIVVRVKDNGPGLSPIQREKILTPFFTTKASGMGMGLSISRSLVEAHHGTLHFNSKEDKGTTFYFTLPTEKALSGRNPS